MGNTVSGMDWAGRFPLRAPILAGWLAAAAFIVGLGGWSVLAPLASATIATGELVVEGSRKVVQHLEGGLLTSVLVKDGDRVAANQPLIELDKTEARSRLDAVRKHLDLALAESARLRAERDGADAIEFPASLTTRSNDPWLSQLLARQRDLLEGRRRAYQGQALLLSREIDTLAQQIQGLRAQQVAAERQLTLIRQEHAAYKSLYDKGFATLPRVLALERAEAQLEGERGNSVSEIAKTQKQIGETELKILQLQKEFYVRAVNELSEAEKTLASLPEQETAAADVLRRTTIVAPSGGVVLALAVHTPGEVIAAGAKLLEIVPQTENLVVRAELPLAQISDVKVGQDAEVKFTSLRGRTTPTVPGHVSYVSADQVKKQDEKAARYEMKIALSPEGVSKLGDAKLIAGMPADVFVHTGSRSVLQYISQPLMDALDRTMREK